RRDGKNGGCAIHHDCDRGHRAGRQRRHDLPVRGLAFGRAGSHRRRDCDALCLHVLPFRAARFDIREIKMTPAAEGNFTPLASECQSPEGRSDSSAGITSDTPAGQSPKIGWQDASGPCFGRNRGLISANCACSVEPSSAVVEATPPAITCVSASKYPVPTKRWCFTASYPYSASLLNSFSCKPEHAVMPFSL